MNGVRRGRVQRMAHEVESGTRGYRREENAKNYADRMQAGLRQHSRMCGAGTAHKTKSAIV